VRENPAFEATDPAVVRNLVRANPWATLVSSTAAGLVASHYPILLDEEADGLTILTHVGRPDERLHELGEHEAMVIVQGEHGYVSPGWYPPSDGEVPTWNFTVAHCHGVPELLGAEENLAVLTRLVERFERELPEPYALDPAYGAEVARGTVGLRIPVTRFVCKRKLSQNKDDATRRRVIAGLREPGPFHHPALAAEMERELEAGRPEAGADPS
jgi:transcriptional regulator